MHRRLAIGLAAAALLALPTIAGAEETRSRPAVAAHPTQTCSRPSTCETDAAKRAEALGSVASNPAGEGFDWGDAGVGAGAGFGLALVGGCVLAIRRSGNARLGHP
jgi:hypothetical protein